MTIDKLLEFVCQGIQVIQNQLPTKDRRILLSLTRQISQGNFLTENQGRLLVKIFKENIDAIKNIDPDAETIISNNLWSKKFRVIQRNRQIYIPESDPSVVSVEFTFDKGLKDKLHELNAFLDGGIHATTGITYNVQLTEKNILLLVDKFKNDSFTIDQKIMNFYQEIQEIVKNTKEPFDVFDLESKNLKKVVEDNVGEITKENLLMLHDRKIRYQYQISEKIDENSLTAKIAQRTNTKIFINRENYSLTEVLSSLKDLNRFPVLTIFEGHSPQENRKFLDFLSKSLDELQLNDEVGIYFRFDKEEDTVGFNSEIAKLQYNKVLSDKTVVAGIANNKIPKFMVKDKWKPSTVISFTNNFKNNKSYVYCSNVDLVIYWSNVKPLNGLVNAIV